MEVLYLHRTSASANLGMGLVLRPQFLSCSRKLCVSVDIHCGMFFRHFHKLQPVYSYMIGYTCKVV